MSVSLKNFHGRGVPILICREVRNFARTGHALEISLNIYQQFPLNLFESETHREDFSQQVQVILYSFRDITASMKRNVHASAKAIATKSSSLFTAKAIQNEAVK